MLSKLSLLATILLTLQFNVFGYMIDDDCKDDTRYVRERVDAAFDMIDNAVKELNKNPLNPQVDTWHNTLFGSRFNAAAGAAQNIRTRFAGLLPIKDYNNEDQTKNGIIDVRFYCTAKRIEKVGKKFRNKDRDLFYKEDDTTSPGGRFANCYDIKPATLMITFTINAQYSEVQICPWFLSNARGYKYKDLRSLPASLFYAASKITIPIAAKVKYTPLDVFNLIDKTIVHELMHIDAHTPIPAKDIGANPYGFKNAKKMADDYRQDQSQLDPSRNADSNSLFAVGAWLIANGHGPINGDGSFG